MSIKRIKDEIVGISKYYWVIEIVMIFCIILLFVNEVIISMDFTGPLWAYIKASTVITGTYKAFGALFFVPLLEGFQNNSPLLVLIAFMILSVRILNIPFLKKRKKTSLCIYGLNYLSEFFISVLVIIRPSLFLSDLAIQKYGFVKDAVIWSIFCVAMLFSVILNVRQQNQETATQVISKSE